MVLRGGDVVEFRSWLRAGFDFCGESVGLFKLSAPVAEKIIAQTRLYLEQGRRHDPYEEAIRDVLLTSPRHTFGFEDITGMAWIEIDFAADVERARREILPHVLAAEGRAGTMAQPGGDPARRLEQGVVQESGRSEPTRQFRL